MTEPPTHTPMIHGAITAIIADLPAFGKDAEMEQGQRYRYRSIDSMLPHFKELFATHGVHVAPVYEVLVDTTITTRGGAEMTRAVVKGMFRFVCAEDGSSVACQTIGEARDSGDKAFNKAMTAAYKYALIQTFAVADADDPDHHRPELEGAPVAEPVRYPNFDALKALGPTLKAADLTAEVKMFAEAHHIDMRPGHDEDGLALVLAEANRRLAEVASVAPAAVTTVVNNTITAPPPVPDTDVVAQARRELDEVLARDADDAEPGVLADSVDPEVAEQAEGEAMARIMDQFGPGTEVIEDGAS